MEKPAGDPRGPEDLAATIYRLLGIDPEAEFLTPEGRPITVVNNGKAEIRKVRVTRDLGTKVEVDAGVKPGDRVILNPPVSLVEGSKVQVSPDAAGLALG